MDPVEKHSKKLTELLERHYEDVDGDAIKRAVAFTIDSHGTQTRYSGDPYYIHPVAVAEMLAEMHLDATTVITALLHDTIEDTDATFEDIEKEFGGDIARLVDGVTKLTKMEYQSVDMHQAENFRKLLIAISKDIRVLLIKLTDRLHNMQTLHFIKKPEKRQRIANETMEIYATLAERIGMHVIKVQLQNIAFKELNPDAFESIQSRLQYLRDNSLVVADRVRERLEEILKKENIKSVVTGREKAPYSIWRKMQKKNVTFEQLSDIMAFRIKVDSVEECYRVLGLVHSNFHMVPDSFDDYISLPKDNGYQSIHTVVIGPEQRRIEIQIRTVEMDEVAEMGIAAHWSYKQDRDYSTDGKQYRWIREMLSIIENANELDEFLENTRLEMYQDQVFCFTPQGKLLALPAGATPVDFAFGVHTDIGLSCVGSKINGRIVPLRTHLSNGDQVEIITSKTQRPSPTWEKFVVTGKARSEIRKYIRNQEFGEYERLGKSILAKTFHNAGMELHDKMLEKTLEKLGKKTIADLYVAVGEGSINKNEVLNILNPNKGKGSNKRLSLLSMLKRRKRPDVEKISVPISGLIPGMAIHFAGCCHPLPGEKIVGIVNTGKGVTIHSVDCVELDNFLDTPERWIDVAWEKHGDEQVYVGRLKAILSHKAGSLGVLSNTVAKEKGNINNLRIVNRSSDFFEILLDVEVRDINHLAAVMASLRSKKSIQSVERYVVGKG